MGGTNSDHQGCISDKHSWLYFFMDSSFSEEARSWTKCLIMDDKSPAFGTNKGRAEFSWAQAVEIAFFWSFASCFIPSVAVVIWGRHWCQSGLSHKKAANNTSFLQGLLWFLSAHPSHLVLFFPLMDPTSRRHLFPSWGLEDWPYACFCGFHISLKSLEDLCKCWNLPHNSQVYLARKEIV